MATFNPYKEAAKDAAMQRNATRKFWRGWCCKCNTEKPMKGGSVLDKKKGDHFVGRSGGVVQRFICAECLAKRAQTLGESSGN
jgi:hypothetical protein